MKGLIRRSGYDQALKRLDECSDASPVPLYRQIVTSLTLRLFCKDTFEDYCPNKNSYYGVPPYMTHHHAEAQNALRELLSTTLKITDYRKSIMTVEPPLDI